MEAKVTGGFLWHTANTSLLLQGWHDTECIYCAAPFRQGGLRGGGQDNPRAEAQYACQPLHIEAHNLRYNSTSSTNTTGSTTFMQQGLSHRPQICSKDTMHDMQGAMKGTKMRASLASKGSIGCSDGRVVLQHQKGCSSCRSDGTCAIENWNSAATPLPAV